MPRAPLWCMLGVQRRVTKDPDTGATYLEMIQPDYINAMYENWKPHLNKREVNTPMPPGIFLCQRDKFGDIVEVSDEEVSAVNKRELDKCSTVLPHPGQMQYNFGFLVLHL